MFVLWVNKGRPEASASIYPWEGNLVHDFASFRAARNWWRATAAA